RRGGAHLSLREARGAARRGQRRGIRNISMAEQKGSKVRQERKGSVRRRVITILLVVAAFALAAYLGFRKRASRLDTFAQCLSAKQAKMYGAYWWPHCADQKEIFGRYFRYLSFVQ